MARPRKTAEMEVIYSNLKSATIAELNQVIEKCNDLIKAKKQAEIEAKEEQIKNLQKELEALKNA